MQDRPFNLNIDFILQDRPFDLYIDFILQDRPFNLSTDFVLHDRPFNLNTDFVLQDRVFNSYTDFVLQDRTVLLAGPPAVHQPDALPGQRPPLELRNHLRADVQREVVVQCPLLLQLLPGRQHGQHC